MGHAFSGTYDATLVILSVAIAVGASYTALDLAGRVGAAVGWARRVWLATAAVAMGGGIWAMHFVAMLAFSLPVPAAYDPGLTLLSFAVAVIVTGVGFAVIGRGAGAVRIGLAGLLMGLGIAAMHYTGMAAMRLPGRVAYDPLLVAASVLIAVGASVAALRLAARPAAAVRGQVLAACAMGMAIAGMHYTGMHAASFVGPEAVPGAAAHGHAGAGQAGISQAGAGQAALAVGVAAVTFLILSLSLLAAAFDRRLARLAAREAEALRASEARFRALYRRTPLPLHSVGPDGAVTEASDAWLALLGYAREEVVGRPLAAFMPPDCARRHTEEHWPALLAGRDLREAECQLVARDGRIVEVLLSASPERDADGRLVRCLGGVVDVTARRRAEEALRQSQKLEAIGRLTGGIAHDFNNLLTVVLGALSALERHASGDERARRTLEAARQAVRRGARLSQDLLAFARRSALRPEPLDVAALLRDFATLLRRALGETITLELALEPGLPPCLADAAQLQTAVLNLVVNARDAMPGGGTLSIRAARAELGPADLAANEDAAPGTFVALSVRDTGHGMAPEVLARAFEPFFTTKGPGRGTGLGLAQVYGFVRQLGGHVVAESRPGAGTTVTLYLPAAAAAAEADRPRRLAEGAPGAMAKVPSATALVAEDEPAVTALAVEDEPAVTALVVEDEPAVREAAAEMLREGGWRVIAAADGQEALAVLQAGEAVDVLFSDMVMPGMDGVELARAAQRLAPGLPVLLATGYAGGGGAPGGEAPAFEVLPKPYERDELLARLGSLVQTPATTSLTRRADAG